MASCEEMSVSRQTADVATNRGGEAALEGGAAHALEQGSFARGGPVECAARSLLRVTDWGAVSIAGLIAYYLRFASFEIDSIELYALVVGIILTISIFEFSGLYASDRVEEAVRRSVGCSPPGASSSSC